jgi:GT2 family glycosyltransferase
LFDPRYFLYFEEVDHCRRVRGAGWKVICYPFTKVLHLGGESAVTTGPLTQGGRQISRFQIESELLYFRKHHGWRGVTLALLLTALSQSLRAAKALVLKFDVRQTGQALKQLQLTIKAALITSWGSKPADWP